MVWHGRKKGGLWYEHVRASSNYRMTEWQAAVLLAQLTRLADQTAIRERNGQHLDRRFAEADCGVTPARVDARRRPHRFQAGRNSARRTSDRSMRGFAGRRSASACRLTRPANRWGISRWPWATQW